MNAKETIKYLYEHGHIPSREHYDIITEELHALSIKSRFNDWLLARAEIRKLQAEIEQLRRALLTHRWDLHCGSNRPCPTCRESAKALGLKVPDQCASKEWDLLSPKNKGGGQTEVKGKSYDPHDLKSQGSER